MAAAAVVSLYLQIGLGWNGDEPRQFAYIMIVTVTLTSIAWLAVTWLTPPERAETLAAFYRRVHPDGPGWRPVARALGVTPGSGGTLAREVVNALLGCVLVYGALFGVGELLLGSGARGVVFLLASALAAYVIARNLTPAGQESAGAPFEAS